MLWILLSFHVRVGSRFIIWNWVSSIFNFVEYIKYSHLFIIFHNPSIFLKWLQFFGNLIDILYTSWLRADDIELSLMFNFVKVFEFYNLKKNCHPIYSHGNNFPWICWIFIYESTKNHGIVFWKIICNSGCAKSWIQQPNIMISWSFKKLKQVNKNLEQKIILKENSYFDLVNFLMFRSRFFPNFAIFFILDYNFWSF